MTGTIQPALSRVRFVAENRSALDGMLPIARLESSVGGKAPFPVHGSSRALSHTGGKVQALRAEVPIAVEARSVPADESAGNHGRSPRSGLLVVKPTDGPRSSADALVA